MENEGKKAVEGEMKEEEKCTLKEESKLKRAPNHQNLH